jgi:DNA invertase Pin-like site-specific DNA recombinase
MGNFMGYFKNLEIDVIEMFREDGMKETEIATSLGISVLQVHEILAAYENRDMDYDESDTDMVSYDDLEFDPGDVDYNAEHY